MTRFLMDIAQQLMVEFGTNPGEHCVVFPNRRSMLYFSKYLATETNKPIWSPGMLTINELFENDTNLVIADSLTLIFRLFDVYRELWPKPVSLDDFFFWGEMMINDFDDIDKYLVDPDKLFSNMIDLKEIEERFGGLSPETIEVIRKFWVNFKSGHMTAEKSDFLAVWEILGPLYKGFKKVLLKEGIAYEGMLVRDQVSRFEDGEWKPEADWRLIHFVGFNALNLCEERMMIYLKNAGLARFYWDYDEFYIKGKGSEFQGITHEAGYFISSNLEKFGQDFTNSSLSQRLTDNQKKMESWNVFSSPSDIAQAKLIPGILESFGKLSNEPDDTAIILADENLLLPVLNTIPENVKNTNVTMGYPMTQTPLYSLIHNLLKLQKNHKSESGISRFYHSDVKGIIRHQYINSLYPEDCNNVLAQVNRENIINVPSSILHCNELFKIIFNELDGPVELVQYLNKVVSYINPDNDPEEVYENNETENPDTGDMLRKEYSYRLSTALNQLQTVFGSFEDETGFAITLKLIDRIMKTLVIPFAGEPLKGLQLMGILETRALDFRNLIFLSVNEGRLPASSKGNSYIPYNLREAFGLPTVKHQDSIYAYYFYRLLQNADKVSFVFNNNSEGLRSGEMSRFLLQLKYGPNRPIFRDTRFLIVPPARFSEEIIKDKTISSLLSEKYQSSETAYFLSPSALNSYVTCSMKFYYTYVVGIREPDDVTEKVDSPVFGNILHEAMNRLLKEFEGKMLGGNDILRLLKDDELLSNVINNAIRSEFIKNEYSKISGPNLVVAEVAKDMVRRVLNYDNSVSPINIMSLERRYVSGFASGSQNNSVETRIGGLIDRIDKVNGITRILDYKSGGDNLEIKSIENLFQYDVQRNGAAFQTLVYCEIYSRLFPEDTIRPSLYPVRKMYSDSFSDLFNVKGGENRGTITDYTMVRELFLLSLEKLISEIFDPDHSFRMTGNTASCTYCRFNIMCSRQNIK